MKHHFLITCFPVQGHINPTLQLAKTLARLGADATFATTTRGLTRLRGSLPTLSRLSYASFSDGHDDETGPTSGNFCDYMADLRRVGGRDLASILRMYHEEDRPVTCLVYSLLVPWAAEVAREMNVPSAFLGIQCATAFTIYHRFFNSHDGMINKEDNGVSAIDHSSFCVSIEDGLPLFSSTDLPTFLLPDNPMNGFMSPMMLEHIKELEKDQKSLVLLNTFQELEQEAIKALENCNLNVVAIGPLIPSAFSDGGDSTDKSFGGDLLVDKNVDYLRWLDSKPEKSVVYVAFGSLVVMSKEQKVEFLHGLVESKKPYLWVIISSNSEQEEEEDKMINNHNGDGMVIPWCSQMEVLSHKSIGCFATHCGWNSTLESLICGVPLICCPHFSDQPTNAKMVEEVWGTGVRARVNGEVVVERGEFKKCLDVVMGDGDRGKEIRKNALKWRGSAMEAVRDGGSTYRNLERVLEN